MSFGIIEVITLLLGMAGFGLTGNPQAPSADQALQYAMSDADVVIQLDAASIVPGNYKLLSQLADQPQIKASPELHKAVADALRQLEGARGMAKLATGLDVTTDLSDATAFVRLVPQAAPAFVLAVRGKLAPQNLEMIARASGGTLGKLESGTTVELGAAQPLLGLTRDGVLLVGTPGLVRDRLADAWKAPRHDAGSSLATAAEVIDAHPVFAVVLTMSRAARDEALQQLGPQGFAADAVRRHKAAAFSVFHDGVGWTWIDSTRAGVDAMEQVSSGAIDLLRAAQIAPRGVAKVAMGVLDSYRGTSAAADELIKHKPDLAKLVDAYTGDGTFKVTSDKNPKTLRLAVRATGKTLSEVFPVGLILPVAAVALLSLRPSEPVQIAAPPAPAAKPAPRPAPNAKPPAAKHP